MAQEPTQKQPGLLELLDEWEKQGASDAEITTWMRDYLSDCAREKGVPLRGVFELTPLCNLDCKMCYVHLTSQQMQKSKLGVLTTEQWKGIMKDAIDSGMIAALLTGGEALLYPGFDELYLYLQSEGMDINVKSNGLLLTKERIDFFRKHVPQALQVSLYGSDDDSYEKVTGHRCFSQVMNGIRRAADAGLELRIAITPSRYMLNNIERVLELVHEIGAEYIIASDLFDPREETGRSVENIGLTLDEYIDLRKIEAKINGQKLKPACKDDYPTPGHGRQEVRGLRCGAGRDGFGINWRGRISPCLMLSGISANLLTMSFAECWRRIHEAVLDYPVPQECEGCAYWHVCSPCVVQHAQGASLGHANPAY